MKEEEFSELSAKILLGDASEEEKLLHTKVREENSSLAEAFDGMESASDILKEYAPLSAAMDATEPKIPDSLLNELIVELNERKANEPDGETDETLGNGIEPNSRPSKTKLLLFLVPLAAAASVAVILNTDTNQAHEPGSAQQIADHKPVPGPTVVDEPPPWLPIPPTPNPPQTEERLQPDLYAAADIEWGHWKDDAVLRGSNQLGESLPEWISRVPLENKKDWEKWFSSPTKAIRVWIDDDVGKLMVLHPGKESAQEFNISKDQKRQLDLTLLHLAGGDSMHILSDEETLHSVAQEYEIPIDQISAYEPEQYKEYIHSSDSDGSPEDKNHLARGTILFIPSSSESPHVVELPPIEKALARKQLFVDFGNTPPELAKIARAAFRLHGGYKMVASTQGHHSFEFKAAGPTQVSLRISSEKPRRTVFTQVYSGADQQAAMLRACDGAVSQTLKIPGFFSGTYAFISDRSGSKEIYVGNALLSSVQSKTNFKKLTYNASWSRDGRGIFFTSNRHTFNNVFLLNLPDGRITTVAKYKGNNLRASQNPITGQVAFILSVTGNPELWLASAPTARPKRVTKNRSNESGPCWSPDGKRLIVASDARGKSQPQLYEVSLKTGALSRIPTNLSSHCTEASWNPCDSSKIAYTAAVSGGFQIALFDQYATHPFIGHLRKSRFLTSGPNDAMQPCWLNDGRHLVFTSRSKSGSKGLMILDTEGVGAKPQALHGTNMGNCSQVSFFHPSVRFSRFRLEAFDLWTRSLEN